VGLHGRILLPPRKVLRHRINLIIMPSERKPHPFIGEFHGPWLVYFDEHPSVDEVVQNALEPLLLASPTCRAEFNAVVLLLQHSRERHARARVFNENFARMVLLDQS
jgi:hypothetical protein